MLGCCKEKKRDSLISMGEKELQNGGQPLWAADDYLTDQGTLMIYIDLHRVLLVHTATTHATVGSNG